MSDAKLLKLPSASIFNTNSFLFCRRQEPIENFPSSSACSSTATTVSTDPFETPPQIIQTSAQPPPLTRGIRFRQSIDSEDELETPTKQEPKQNQFDDGDADKTASPKTSPIPSPTVSPEIGVAPLIDPTDDLASPPSPDTSNNELINKKRAASEEDCTTPKRTKPNPVDIKTLEYFDKSAAAPTNVTPGQSSSSCAKQSTFNKRYSELKYLEAIGSIRTIRLMKHPQVNRIPSTSNVDFETNTPFVSPESQNGWDRKTKLKLSYRIGIDGNDVQYALIIYEPLTMISRRNLKVEFDLAAVYEGARFRKLKPQPPTPKKKKSATYKSLHRLRM